LPLEALLQGAFYIVKEFLRVRKFYFWLQNKVVRKLLFARRRNWLL